MANARAKAETADQAGERAQQDSDMARLKAKEYAPEFHQPGTDIMRKQLEKNEADYDFSHLQQGVGNHQPHRSKSLSTHVSDGPDSPAALAALYGGGGGPGGRMPNDYSMHAQHHPHQQQHHHQLLSTMLPAGPGGGGGINQEQNLNVNQHSRSPSLKVRRYSFLAGSRRGRGFSEIFNSTILNDHFDQYTAADSGIGGRDGLGGGFISSSTAAPLTAANYGNGSASNTTPGVHAKINSYGNHTPRLRQPSTNPSPDSGVSDSMVDEDAVQKSRALQRRRTMPCIVDGGSSNGEGVNSPAHSAQISAAKQQLADRETAISSENLSKQNPETFIIENGIRKRIHAEVHANPNRERRQLPKEYVLSGADPSGVAGSGDKRGSLPDLKTVTDFRPMSRREAHQLSAARRDEIRRLQDLAERRRQGDVSVILGDVRSLSRTPGGFPACLLLPTASGGLNPPGEKFAPLLPLRTSSFCSVQCSPSCFPCRI
ncbi:junctophilin-3-like [Elysia marginata]|uniref:Junctophilin-3-like n=1 Tax=Elysia marginata TaxID=1093978 RepID=A0AAV4I4H4_9GAST|nr:junctophilin-3-like [Elysia marginata]